MAVQSRPTALLVRGIPYDEPAAVKVIVCKIIDEHLQGREERSLVYKLTIMLVFSSRDSGTILLQA